MNAGLPGDTTGGSLGCAEVPEWTPSLLGDRRASDAIECSRTEMTANCS